MDSTRILQIKLNLSRSRLFSYGDKMQVIKGHLNRALIIANAVLQ